MGGGIGASRFIGNLEKDDDPDRARSVGSVRVDGQVEPGGVRPSRFEANDFVRLWDRSFQNALPTAEPLTDSYGEHEPSGAKPNTTSVCPAAVRNRTENCGGSMSAKTIKNGGGGMKDEPTKIHRAGRGLCRSHGPRRHHQIHEVHQGGRTRMLDLDWNHRRQGVRRVQGSRSKPVGASAASCPALARLEFAGWWSTPRTAGRMRSSILTGDTDAAFF